MGSGHAILQNIKPVIPPLLDKISSSITKQSPRKEMALSILSLQVYDIYPQHETCAIPLIDMNILEIIFLHSLNIRKE